MKDTKIILGFPGVGKTYLTNNPGKLELSDSDSSKFSWEEVNGERIRNDDFPGNYIEHIVNNLGRYDAIFVSTHAAVRRGLMERGIEASIVYPTIDQKEDYLNRYKERGSDKAFITLMDDNFETFIKELDDEVHFERIVLKKGETMKDVLVAD